MEKQRLFVDREDRHRLYVPENTIVQEIDLSIVK